MAKDTNKDKIRRDAFLYMSPRENSYGDPNMFAHCASCFMFMGNERERCYILGKKLVVKAEMTCGLYVNGQPEIERAGTEKELVTPEEAGFYEHRPQCKRCYFYLAGTCGLFAKLELKFPQYFDLGIFVGADACCDAFTPKDAEFTDQSLIELLNKKVKWNNPLK